MKLQCFLNFDILVFHILYNKIRIIKKKEKKESRNNTLTPPFPKIDLIMDHTLKTFGQPCLYEKKKDWGGRIMSFGDDSNSCAMCHMHSIIDCVSECVTLTCVRQDLA